jgi:hypothetical protein
MFSNYQVEWPLKQMGNEVFTVDGTAVERTYDLSPQIATTQTARDAGKSEAPVLLVGLRTSSTLPPAP